MDYEDVSVDEMTEEEMEVEGEAESVTLSVNLAPLLAGQQSCNTLLFILVLLEVFRLARGLAGQVFGRR